MTMLEANLASKSGRSARIRTPDRRFWRPLLYQLSYTPVLTRLYAIISYLFKIIGKI